MQTTAPLSAPLIVDMQVGLFRGPDEPHESERVLHNIRELIGRARAAGAPVLAARHTGPAGSPIAADEPAWKLLPELGICESNDFVSNKTRPSCFFGTGAHTCMDTPVARAAQIIAHHNLTLSGPFVRLVDTAAANF